MQTRQKLWRDRTVFKLVSDVTEIGHKVQVVQSQEQQHVHSNSRSYLRQLTYRNPTTGGCEALSSGGSGTLDTTTTSNLDFTITFGGNTAGNSVLVAIANVHILN